MATASVPRPLTAEEYARLPEVERFPDELIEGERVLCPMPKLAHAVVLNRLVEIIKPQLSQVGPNESLSILREAGWRFRVEAGSADSVPGPDLMIVRQEDVRKAINTSDWYEGLPLLVVEVISPSERKSRRLQKIGLYLEMGVSHVVEVDTCGELLEYIVQTPTILPFTASAIT